MADAGWGRGRPVEADTGIYDVLLAYVTQGGQLLGARRWTDNPLTLTHVRWLGRNGGSLEALRRPDHDAVSSPEEREVWVQLALHVPTAQSGPPGGEQPWLPLAVDPAAASAWVNLLKQGRRRAQGSPPFDSSPRAPAWSGQDDVPTIRWDNPGAPPQGPSPANGFAPGETEPPAGVPPFPPYTSPVGSQPERPTGTWQRPTAEASEVFALPCIEVELPPPAGPSTTYRQDFARDVALHFARAVRSIPYVREARGWMRGDRLVLAARFAVANGSRPPTSSEMERAVHHLAGVLAQITLPYVRIGFADPGEWNQGALLPQ
jgi:hypothetical protein